MAQNLSATAVSGRRLRELRATRRLSAQALADRCAALGASDVKRQVISNLENGRRSFIAAEELLTLAWALDVPPVLLMLPIGRGEELEVAPGVTMHAVNALPWITGEVPPADREKRLAWQAAIGPVSTYRAFRAAFDKAARAESAGGDAFMSALRELGRVTDLLIEHDLAPVPLPAEWLSLMTAEGFLKYLDDVPVQPEEGGDDGRP